jgi:hypothetical protein
MLAAAFGTTAVLLLAFLLMRLDNELQESSKANANLRARCQILETERDGLEARNAVLNASLDKLIYQVPK